MTPQRIIALLFAEPLTTARMEKAKGLTLRQRLTWDSVLSAMTDDQRKAITDAA